MEYCLDISNKNFQKTSCDEIIMITKGHKNILYIYCHSGICPFDGTHHKDHSHTIICKIHDRYEIIGTVSQKIPVNTTSDVLYYCKKKYIISMSTVTI